MLWVIYQTKHLNLCLRFIWQNILNNIELDNDTSEGRNFNKITDDETFNNFVDEFNKQSTRIIKQMEKELGYEMPYIPNLNQLFELGKMLEK